MKSTKFNFGVGAGLGLALMSSTVMAGDVYGPFPITLKGYDGDRTNSVSYSGQVARQLLHNSLKKAVGSGASKDVMLGYFNGADGELPLLDPKSKEGFTVDVTDINTVSKTNLSGKAYKGSIPGWPGNMTGKEVLAFMIDMAAGTEKGYDAQHGYDYAQLVSKFTMGGVFYHQACDNYLDEKMNADNKPNDKPYKDGAYYTGKEHSWDEAFGYWGAAAHGATLSPKQNYDITKKKNMRDADANGDGVVNLKSEMNYAHAYYAAGFDKGGKTDYYNTITRAFIDGRQIIADAKGEKLTDKQRFEVKAHARTVCSNWEKVIAEAVFKYAGSVYSNIEAVKATMGGNMWTVDGSAEKAEFDKAVRKYAKYWGELAGFSLSLHTSGVNLGEIGVKMDRLVGMGPVMPDGTQVNGMADGAYTVATGKSMDGFAVHMLKLQKLMVEEFGVEARNNDRISGIANLAEVLGSTNSAEND
ncbi:MAG: DUF4856 domain-containing protein [Pseudomonadota bacterium]|nr:DUF4856 domain-containing protein [Pseudomonadota bacterium]